MATLVTGASGNVGSHVLRELLRREQRVHVLSLPGRSRWPPGVSVHTGDITDPAAVRRAVSEMDTVDTVDTVVHLAAVIPPASDADPVWARAVNVTGTANVTAACRSRPDPPRLLFTSTFDVHGHTQHRPPPRRVGDPLVATDPYTEHKIEGERLVRESGLDWAIFRLTDVPVLGRRDPHPIMFEIGLHNRIEALHGADAALAIATALDTPEVWGRVLFVGGGAACQLTYREYLARLLAAIGLKPLPDKAFREADYVTDWVDTAESEALMHYQRHTFDDIAAAVAAGIGWRRRLMPLAGPRARAAMLRLSPYYAGTR